VHSQPPGLPPASPPPISPPKPPPGAPFTHSPAPSDPPPLPDTPPAPPTPPPPLVPSVLAPSMPLPVCSTIGTSCDNNCECGVCLNLLGTGQCHEHRSEWEAREYRSWSLLCDHELGPIPTSTACHSLGECGTDGTKQNCIADTTGGIVPGFELLGIYFREPCSCPVPPSPPTRPLPATPPAAPPPPTPLIPGEKLATRNVTFIEKFVSTTFDVDGAALDHRPQQYLDAIFDVLGQVFGQDATVTVVVGTKVFVSTSTSGRLRRRRLQTGDECDEDYTPVQVMITLSTAVPTDQIMEVLDSVSDSILDGSNNTIHRCGSVDTVYNGLDIIPTPPPPPPTDAEEIVWWSMWALICIFAATFCCCVLYGCVVWRRDRREPNPWDEKKDALYDQDYEGRMGGRGGGARTPFVFAAALERVGLWSEPFTVA